MKAPTSQGPETGSGYRVGNLEPITDEDRLEHDELMVVQGCLCIQKSGLLRFARNDGGLARVPLSGPGLTLDQTVGIKGSQFFIRERHAQNLSLNLGPRKKV
jgi:hypothetical protein